MYLLLEMATASTRDGGSETSNSFDSSRHGLVLVDDSVGDMFNESHEIGKHKGSKMQVGWKIP